MLYIGINYEGKEVYGHVLKVDLTGTWIRRKHRMDIRKLGLNRIISGRLKRNEKKEIVTGADGRRVSHLDR